MFDSNLRHLDPYMFLRLVSILLPIPVYASFSFDSAGCVDATGFDSCWSSAKTSITNCWTNYCAGQSGQLCTDFFGCQSTSSYCTNACFCVFYANLINCALNQCWNEVYSCNYQQLAILAVNGCNTAKLGNIPFFPAPQNAPGGCSCDISQVYRAGIYANTLESNCNSNISNAENLNQLTPVQGAAYHTDCACCAKSFPVSVFYNICPSTDPSQISFFNNLIHVSGVTSCASSLSSIDCTKNLGFTPPGWDNNSPWVNPNKLPANGTASLSNTAGSGTITTPLSGKSFAWTFGAVTTVAIAVESSGNGVSGSASVSAATTTGVGSTGGSGGAASGTTTATATLGSKNPASGTFAVRDGFAYRWMLAVLAVLTLLS